MKKRILYFILLSLAASVSAYAYDFGTAGIVAGLAGGGIVLGAIVGAVPALVAVTIGAAVMGIQLASSTSVPNDMPIAAQISPSAPLATPPAYTPPAPGYTEPTPPSNVPIQTKWGNGYDGLRYDSASAACVALSSTNSTYHIGADNVTCYNQTNIAYGQMTPYNTCPAGYSSNGTSCNLTNQNIVTKPSDGVCTIKRSGNTFSTDPLDPDCASGKIPATTQITSNSITQTHPDGTSRSITINNDGSTTITESRPNYTTNTTETNITNITAPDASGVAHVSGQGQGVAPGTGTAAGTGTAPTNVTFDKSGLATEGTQTGIHDDTTAIKNALTDTTPGDPLSTTGIDGVVAAHGTAIGQYNNLNAPFNWDWVPGLPPPCGCQPWSYTVLGQSGSYDWCPSVDQIRDLLGWMVYISTGMYLLSIVTRKPA